MSFALVREHVDFFKQNGFIAFEPLLLEPSAKKLQEELRAALAKKMQVSVEKLAKLPQKELFTSAYDLHLIDDQIRKFSHKPKWGKLSSELFEEKTIRFGFSQYLMATSDPTPPFPENGPFAESSCLSPLAGLLLINVGELHGLESSFSLSQEWGSALFLSPSCPFPWKEIYSVPGSNFFLVGFAKEKTCFRKESKDPLSFELKKLGYAWNDFLQEPFHPLIAR